MAKTKPECKTQLICTFCYMKSPPFGWSTPLCSNWKCFEFRFWPSFFFVVYGLHFMFRCDRDFYICWTLSANLARARARASFFLFLFFLLA